MHHAMSLDGNAPPATRSRAFTPCRGLAGPMGSQTALCFKEQARYALGVSAASSWTMSGRQPPHNVKTVVEMRPMMRGFDCTCIILEGEPARCASLRRLVQQRPARYRDTTDAGRPDNIHVPRGRPHRRHPDVAVGRHGPESAARRCDLDPRRVNQVAQDSCGWLEPDCGPVWSTQGSPGALPRLAAAHNSQVWHRQADRRVMRGLQLDGVHA